MKYKIIVSPNVSTDSIECLCYEITINGLKFWTEVQRLSENNTWEGDEIAGFIPHGSFIAILPI